MAQKTDIEYLSRLARMELSAEEKELLEKDLDAIIGYMDTLSKIDTDGVEPMEHVLGLSNVMREDNPVPSYDRETLLRCAPKSEDGFYDVPLAVEQ
ncbi:MAG TPA: Asp-tRNA(Asn)/Glu-tRNA(Gln) amidotransferase subunit GatC [Ruminiclostridium sp.]|nr:Asp-tRNA(Asn)/Glu-tRNA(Gln) amidotransferase subunit GatC [Ruminiclostridium sp.]